MLDMETRQGNSYDNLPFLDKKDLGGDFMDFYRDAEDWDEFESKLLDELIDNPGWLIEDEPELTRTALDILKTSKDSGDPIKARLSKVDERFVVPLFLRMIELFSEENEFKYLWSSSEYSNTTNKDNIISATFDISLDSAMEHYYTGLSGVRKEPCLVRLSIESLIRKYRNSDRHDMEIFFEHGTESAFESIDIKSELDGLDINVFRGIKEENTEEIEVYTQYREVLTDEAVVVGPDDTEFGLEALPAGCGIVAMVDQENNIVGMIHASILIKKVEAENLVLEIIRGVESRGGDVKKLAVSSFNMSANNRLVLENAFLELVDLKIDLSGTNIDVNNCVVRINKNTCVVEEVDLQGNNSDVSYWQENERLQHETQMDRYWDDEEERLLEESYHQDQFEDEDQEKKLENPRGHLVALQVVEIDEKTLEIQWISPTYKPTRFSANGPQAEMYKFLRKKYPDLKKSAGAGFFILTDDDGNPTEVGDIGDQKNAAKLIEEQDN